MRKQRYTAADPQCGPAPKYFGRGGNIRFVTPAGEVVQGDPVAYRKLPRKEQRKVVAGVMQALSA